MKSPDIPHGISGRKANIQKNNLKNVSILYGLHSVLSIRHLDDADHWANLLRCGGEAIREGVGVLYVTIGVADLHRHTCSNTVHGCQQRLKHLRCLGGHNILAIAQHGRNAITRSSARTSHLTTFGKLSTLDSADGRSDVGEDGSDTCRRSGDTSNTFAGLCGSHSGNGLTSINRNLSEGNNLADLGHRLTVLAYCIDDVDGALTNRLEGLTLGLLVLDLGIVDGLLRLGGLLAFRLHLLLILLFRLTLQHSTSNDLLISLLVEVGLLL